MDANQLLPVQRTYLRYNGSLTTPPCTEGVKWLVMYTPVEVSDAQIAAFTSVFKNNERPVQPFNARTFLVPATLPRTGNTVPMPDGVLIGAGMLILVGGFVLAYVSRRNTL